SRLPTPDSRLPKISLTFVKFRISSRIRSDKSIAEQVNCADSTYLVFFERVFTPL
ncbi:MAG: hypothetical protein F6K20_38075, partial [Moorea sp. SIO2C4]|nr:hypothetical protein [Moorena sp. SIO2C4]